MSGASKRYQQPRSSQGTVFDDKLKKGMQIHILEEWVKN